MAAQIGNLASGAQSSDDQQFYNYLAARITEDLRAGAQNTFSFTTVGPLNQHQYAELQRCVQNIVGQPVQINMDALANTVTLAQTEQHGLMLTPTATTPQESEVSVDAAVEKPKKKVPRPANAFIIYRKDQHATVVALHPGLHNNAISIIIGKQWKNESTEVREMYQRKAADAKQQHLLAYPGYQYQPRKPSEKKKRMTKNKLAKLAAAKSNSVGNAASQQQMTGLQDQRPLGVGEAPLVPQAPAFVPAPELEFIDLPNMGQVGSFTAGDDVNGQFAGQAMQFNHEHPHLPAIFNAPVALAATTPVDELLAEGLQECPMPVAHPSEATYGANYIGDQDGSLTHWDFTNPAEDFQPTFEGFEQIEPEGLPAYNAEVHRQALLDQEASNNIGDFFDFEEFLRDDTIQ